MANSSGGRAKKAVLKGCRRFLDESAPPLTPEDACVLAKAFISDEDSQIRQATLESLTKSGGGLATMNSASAEQLYSVEQVAFIMEDYGERLPKFAELMKHGSHRLQLALRVKEVPGLMPTA
jgi:hypothetical protein